MTVKIINADPKKDIIEHFHLRASTNKSKSTDWELREVGESQNLSGISVIFGDNGKKVKIKISLTGNACWRFIDKDDVKAKNSNSDWEAYGNNNMYKKSIKIGQIRTPAAMKDRVGEEDITGILVDSDSPDNKLPTKKLSEDKRTIEMEFSRGNAETVNFAFVAYKQKSNKDDVWKGFVSNDPSFTIRCQ